MQIHNYTTTLNYILSKNIKDIIASHDCLTLIKLYSDLYLGGAQCRTCANSQRKYYEELKKTGKMAIESKTRTCVPNWNGIIYISGTGLHYNSETITDEQAKILLSKGYLKDDMFARLPIIEKESNELVITKEMQACIDEIKEQLTAGVSKTKIKDRYKSVSNIGGEKCSQKLVIELIKLAENENN